MKEGTGNVHNILSFNIWCLVANFVKIMYNIFILQTQSLQHIAWLHGLVCKRLPVWRHIIYSDAVHREYFDHQSITTWRFVPMTPIIAKSKISSNAYWYNIFLIKRRRKKKKHGLEYSVYTANLCYIIMTFWKVEFSTVENDSTRSKPSSRSGIVTFLKI